MPQRLYWQVTGIECKLGHRPAKREIRTRTTSLKLFTSRVVTELTGFGGSLALIPVLEVILINGQWSVFT